MRIKLASLSAQIDKGLTPLYLLFGGETLLIEEALDEIRRQARAQGYAERVRFTQEAGFDWGQVIASCRSMSLFAEKKVVELRIPTGKPGDVGAKALTDYAAAIDGDDTVLVIICGGVDKSAQKTKWFKAVEEAGVAVDCPPIAAQQLPAWVVQRMRGKGLKFDDEAAKRLAVLVEGNLLAAAQAIDLLALLSPHETITAAAIESAIADHARFNSFAFVDACLAGAPQRCTRILQSLRANRAEPVLILWALTREVRALCHLSAGLARGEKQQALFRRHGVWSSRANLISGALKRLSAARCHNLLRQLAAADLMLKGRAALQRQNIWEEIESIGLGVCGVEAPPRHAGR